MTITNLITALEHIVQEKTTENHWMFESTNYPNLKKLRIQKTNPISKETIISQRGFDFESKKWYNDLISDNAILWGLEKQDKRFKNAQSHF